MLNREKLRNKLNLQVARDHTRMRHWYERREKRIRDGMENPVLPVFCRICLIGMIAGAAMVASGDIASALQRGGLTPGSLKSAALSALIIWSVFGAGLDAGCVIQLKKGFGHPWFEAHSLKHSGRRRMDWGQKYRLWFFVAVIGLLVLLCVYGILKSAFA